MNLSSKIKYLTLKSFDTSTEQGRSDERYRLATLSFIANILSRGASMLAMLLSVSLTIRYLGAERFGVWMTISSLLGMLSFLDLGVGNALTNRVSQAAALQSKIELRNIISGGVFFLFILGIVISLVLLILTEALPWGKLIKTNYLNADSEIENSLKVFSVMFGFFIFTNGIQKIYSGLQRSFVTHIISFIGTIISIIALWFAAEANADIPLLILSTLGVQQILNLGLLRILYKNGMLSLSKILKNSKHESNRLIKVGGLFFILQIGTMVGWGADSLIISSIMGASQVAIFNVTQKIFFIISQPVAMVNSTLWGAYADAHSRKDKLFIKATFKKSLVGTLLITAIGGTILLTIYKPLVDYWTKGAIFIPFGLIFAYLIWSIFEVAGNALAMLLNGCGVIREQVITVVTLTIIAVPAKLMVAEEFGVIGMIAVYTLLYCTIVSFFYGFVFKKDLTERLF